MVINMDNNILEQYLTTLSSSHRIMLSAIHTLNQQEETIRQLVSLPARENTQNPINREHVYPFTISRTNALSELLSQSIVNALNNASPVVLRPTDLQIQQATEHLLFSELPEDIEKIYTCPVSHDTFNDNSEITRICHCGHYFGREAIMRWFSLNVHCPICRYDIRNMPTTSESSQAEDYQPEPNPSSTNENAIYYTFDVMY